MQLTITPSTPAEARLTAAFLQDYADLLELQKPAEPTTTQADTAPAAARRARKPKDEPTTQVQTALTGAEAIEKLNGIAYKENDGPGSREAAVEAGKPQHATTAEQAVASGASETAEVADTGKAKTQDDIKILFGQLAQEGKRDEAIALIRSFGHNGVSKIPDDQTNMIYSKLFSIRGA